MAAGKAATSVGGHWVKIPKMPRQKTSIKTDEYDVVWAIEDLVDAMINDEEIPHYQDELIAVLKMWKES